MDEQEVERLARLMHETHRAFVDERDTADAKAHADNPPSVNAWEKTSSRYKERIMHVARTVLAELTAVPTAVITASPTGAAGQ